ncbi:carboxy-terminal processing protease CtpA [Peptoclostridium acidaminophilum DSM 3953]|uniref:Carboxy-terminal processing protease CtpA n=1 Tax=Peptoclostridium acidaminophilum DSM 3953 TaxID=1286171 RepID=W8TMA8_PEPAC|nr:S41 family peptidase [Peptoclostridium acidaminophilum]AHM57342.1 carboxy-terminal processing protease CtpA [Peptoclostridium acidaminophilum DSM 3953]
MIASKLKRTASIALIAVMSFTSLSFGEDFNKDMSFFNAAKEYILNNYVDEVTEDQLIDGAVKGMYDSLDKYSTYLDAEENKQFTEDVQGTFSGIGAQIALKNGNVTIVEPLENSPALKAGLLPGDIIKAIDGKEIGEVKNLVDVVNKIKGPQGTAVKLLIERKGQSFQVSIIRDNVVINPVKSRVLENGIGYIRITEFNKTATQNTLTAIEELKAKGINKLVLDLRGNPGGGLLDVVGIAQEFVPKGNIVKIQYKDGAENSYPSYGNVRFAKVAVLVDESSASASEILAGAIQDTKSGVLVGKNTYGKGTVQKVLNLKNGEAIKLTIAKYLLPSGRSIDHTGLVPDVVAERYVEGIVDLGKLQALPTDKAMKAGDAGLDVLGLQERLLALGFKTTDSKGIYGQSTTAAVSAFQSSQGLYPYGVADKTTLGAISESFTKLMLSDQMDNQLDKALEYLRSQQI